MIIDMISQMICFSKNGLFASNDDMVKKPRNEITNAEENIIQSIFKLDKNENIPELIL